MGKVIQAVKMVTKSSIAELMALESSKSPEDTELDRSFPKMGVMKRDFVIVGKAGKPNNEKDIRYLWLVWQMAEAVVIGYAEKEVVAAMRKAISPKNLRTYLEMDRSLTLSKL